MGVSSFGLTRREKEMHRQYSRDFMRPARPAGADASCVFPQVVSQDDRDWLRHSALLGKGFLRCFTLESSTAAAAASTAVGVAADAMIAPSDLIVDRRRMERPAALAAAVMTFDASRRRLGASWPDVPQPQRSDVSRAVRPRAGAWMSLLSCHVLRSQLIH